MLWHISWWLELNWKQVAVPAVLECSNCSLHVMVGSALSETVATVSLSTVPRLSHRRAFTQGSNDAAEVRGSFQETAPRKTAENTVKHCDGGVGSVVDNHCGGGESGGRNNTSYTTAVWCLLLTFHSNTSIRYVLCEGPLFLQLLFYTGLGLRL